MNYDKYYLNMFAELVDNLTEEEIAQYLSKDPKDCLLMSDTQKVDFMKELPDEILAKGLIAPVVDQEFMENETYWRHRAYMIYGLSEADIRFMSRKKEIDSPQISNTNRRKLAAANVWVNSRPYPDYQPLALASMPLELLLAYVPNEHTQLVTEAYKALHAE